MDCEVKTIETIHTNYTEETLTQEEIIIENFKRIMSVKNRENPNKKKTRLQKS